MSVRVAVFGRAAFTVGARPATPAGAIPRAIVARLALEAGEPLSSEHLISEVWATPPAAAEVSLRAYVSRLKNTPLGRALGGGRGGYSLAVDDDSVDVLAFRRAAAGARASGAVGDLLAAAALWHSDPFGDLEQAPFTRRFAGELWSERLAVVETAGEALLEEGRFADLVELVTPVARHFPLHERPVVLLASALARLGRTSDALAEVDGFRAAIAEQHGLDVSAEIDAVRLAIVRHDRSVTASPTRRSPRVRRRGIPLPLTGFVGRETELAAIAAARGDARLVTLVGPGGVGKTRLSIEAARRASDPLDDEQWMLELASRPAGSDLVAALAETLQVAAPTLDAVVARLDGRRALLVIDNAEHVRADAAALVSALLAGCEGLGILVTSREPLALAGERVISIEPFTGAAAADGLELFTRRVQDARAGRSLDVDDRATAVRICALLDGLPLALELAAARSAVVSLDELSSSIEAHPAALGAMSGAGRHESLENTIRWSTALLPADELELLAQLGNFGGPFTLDAVAGICRVGSADARRITVELARKSLIAVADEQQGTRAYRLLESTKAFARGLGQRDRDGWFVRRREWLASAVETSAPQLYSDASVHLQWWLDVLSADLRAALDDAVAAGDASAALRLASGQVWHWVRRGRLVEGRAFSDQAMSLDDGRPSPEADLARAQLMHGTTVLAFMSGDLPATARYASDGLAFALRAGDPSYLAVLHGFRAYWQAVFGDLSDAEAAADDALAASRDAEPWARSEVMMLRGQVLRSLGRPAQALEALEAGERLGLAAGHGWAVIPSVGISVKILIELGRGQDAIARVAPTAVRAYADGDPTSTLATLHQSTGAAAMIDRHREAAIIIGAVDNLGRRYAYDPRITEPDDAALYRRRAREGLTDAEWTEAHAIGQRLTLGEALGVLISIVRSV
jgi:predicted ATPase/DNA-binding SARP family transcriptional activator